MADSLLSDGSGAAASMRVVRRVACETGTDTAELPPLYDAIDPEALDAVVGSAATTSVTFTYADYVVSVDADGTVSVDSEDR